VTTHFSRFTLHRERWSQTCRVSLLLEIPQGKQVLSSNPKIRPVVSIICSGEGAHRQMNATWC